MKLRTRRVIVFTGSMIVAWAVAIFITAELVRPSASRLEALGATGLVPTDALSWRLARAIVAGTSAGLLATFVELRILPVHARRLTPVAMLFLRTATYAGVAGVTILSTVRFIARREFRVPVEELLFGEGFQSFVRSGDLFQFALALVVASFLINASFQISRLLGPGTARQILIGRYARPVEEDRLFMFVDLSDSTALAETLGAVRFAEFKNDFFHELAEPVLDTRAQIVQYVGDEVLLTWPMARTDSVAAAMRFFFLLKARVSSRALIYEGRYGSVPCFRAGLHGGRVVVSQLGDIKREIVFSGDAVNTASRIQSLCRELGADFLASEEILGTTNLLPGVQANSLGAYELKGKASPMRLVALSRGGVSAPQESEAGSA